MKHAPTYKRIRRSAEERKQQIITAAVTLFARQGFARTTTKEIAAEAGISEGTIYKYFSSKQELLFAFIESYAVQPLYQLLSPPPVGDDAAVMRAFFRNRFSLAERNRPLMKVVLGEALFNQELAREFARKIVAPITSLLEAFVAERIRQGRFRKMDPRVAAGAMGGLFLSFAVLWPALLPKGKRLPSREVLADQLTELILTGVSTAALHPIQKAMERTSHAR